MDRRQTKTRQAIYEALSLLLETKQYNQITVQQIIDEANIGRSTFYAHFETKNELLNAMCKDIFEHVFSFSLEKEVTHDFSNNSDSLLSIVEHLFCHLWEKRNDIRRILKSESNSVFIGYLEKYLKESFKKYRNIISEHIPKEYALFMLCGGFADTLKWWLASSSEYSPKEVAFFYLESLSGVLAKTN